MRGSSPPGDCAFEDWQRITGAEYQRKSTINARKRFGVRFKAGNLDDLVTSTSGFSGIGLVLSGMLSHAGLNPTDENVLRLIEPIFMIHDRHATSEMLTETSPDIDAGCAREIANALEQILRDVTDAFGDIYRDDFYAGALSLAYDALQARHAPSRISTQLMAA